jgi:predicted peptidase
MRIALIISVLMLSFVTIGTAQLTAIKGKADYNFWLYTPKDSILKSNPPVLIFLHGRSLSGSDLNLVKKYGVIHEIENGKEIPAVVIAPQVSSGKSWEPSKIKSVLDYVQSIYATDSNRVYVTGMSLGGYGTLHFVGAYPELVAAAVALCGGGKVSDGCDLAEVPLWIQHGNKDAAVPISESEKIVKAIKDCNGGSNLKYTVVEGADHGDLEKAFRTSEIYDWMFQYSKAIETLTEEKK